MSDHHVARAISARMQDAGARGQTTAPPAASDDVAATAAVRFYRDALRGRLLPPPRERASRRALSFLIGDTRIEVEPGASVVPAAPVAVVVDDPVAIAERCWDAGYTVRVHDGPASAPSLFVADPFGRVIALVGRTMTTTCPSPIAAGEEQR